MYVMYFETEFILGKDFFCNEDNKIVFLISICYTIPISISVLFRAINISLKTILIEIL